jgi:phosphatidate cytidylyltransferase
MSASKSLSAKGKPAAHLPDRPKGLPNMVVRILTGVPLMAFAILCLYLGDWPWVMFIGLAAVVGMLEFYALAQNRPEMGFTQVGVPATVAIFIGIQYGWGWLVVLALLFGLVGGVSMALGLGAPWPRALRQGGMTLAGLMYVALPLALTLILRHRLGVGGVMLALAITIATDSFAYFGGRFWGRTPMAPRISPKKTMEGLIAGLVFGSGFAVLTLHLMGILSWGSAVVAVIGPPLAVLGDLWESWLKRVYDVKDSHLPNLNIIPGHGGVLDRADSMLLVAPFLVGYLGLLGLLN